MLPCHRWFREADDVIVADPCQEVIYFESIQTSLCSMDCTLLDFLSLLEVTVVLFG